jgi:glycosyltransferase involved in cell wall biosynthesis
VSVLERTGLIFEIVLVDDGSTDETFAKLQKLLSASTRYIRHLENQGKGAALRSGIETTSTDLIAMIDADLDIDPEGLILGMDILLRNNEIDFAIGSKHHILSKVEYPIPRKLMSFVYRSINRLMLGRDFPDSQTGLKVYRSKSCKLALLKTKSDSFDFEIESTFNLIRLGLQYVEFPVTLEYRFTSTVKFRHIWQLLKATIRLFRMRNLNL